ncbi:MAG: NAD(P)H-dependent oxidoreductase subunit E [Deltaproteobacteria bacterium]|nr:NAD(P)H-dependent oxidoreductase subunit E [Deltaproteobacteria bacterium]
MENTLSHLKHIDSDKGNIIKGLQLIQKNEGYLSDRALEICSHYFSVPLVEIQGIVTFYSQFKRTKPGKYQISICDGTACHLKGATLILDWIATELNIGAGETDSTGLFSLETVACLGCCSLAPVMSVNGDIFGNLSRKGVLQILKRYKRQG